MSQRDHGGESAHGGVQLGREMRDGVSGGGQFIGQAAICRRLGIGVSTWRDWRRARRVPAPVPNVPGRPRWRVRDIEAFESGLGVVGGRAFRAARRG